MRGAARDRDGGRVRGRLRRRRPAGDAPGRPGRVDRGDGARAGTRSSRRTSGSSWSSGDADHPARADGGARHRRAGRGRRARRGGRGLPRRRGRRVRGHGVHVAALHARDARAPVPVRAWTLLRSGHPDRGRRRAVRGAAEGRRADALVPDRQRTRSACTRPPRVWSRAPSSSPGRSTRRCCRGCALTTGAALARGYMLGLKLLAAGLSRSAPSSRASRARSSQLLYGDEYAGAALPLALLGVHGRAVRPAVVLGHAADRP